MKRRRTKDYVKLLETLIKEARKIGLTLKPIQVMIDEFNEWFCQFKLHKSLVEKYLEEFEDTDESAS